MCCVKAASGSRCPETHLWVATAIWGLLFGFGTILYKVCLMLGGGSPFGIFLRQLNYCPFIPSVFIISFAATIFLIFVVSILGSIGLVFIDLVFLIACTVILCVF
jgi:hypothetical protein